MSFYIHNIFKAATLALAFSFISCMQIEEGGDEAVGYLCGPALDVDVTVADLTQTKALDFTVVTPELDDVRFLVKDRDGKVKYDADGLWEKLVLPVGKYSVEASYGTNSFDAPYFYGKTADDASVGVLENETPALKLALANSIVRIGLAEEFASHFTLETVTLTSGGVEKVLSAKVAADWCYVPAGQTLTVKLDGKNSAGVPAGYTHTLTPAAKIAYNVVCGGIADETKLPKITMPDQSAGAWAGRLYVTPAEFSNISAANQAKVEYEILLSGTWTKAEVISAATETVPSYQVFRNLANGRTYSVRARIGNLESEPVSVTVNENLAGTGVTIAHYNDDSGNLAGSDAVLTLGLTGILNTLKTAGYLQISGLLLSNGSEEVRTAAADGVMKAADGWPYLPQGSGYSLTVKHRLSSESSDVESVKSSLSSPAPVFTVTLNNSYSSYDEYVGSNGIAKNIGNANTRTAESIYNVGASWSISSTLMSNTNYKDKSAIIILDGDKESRKITPTTNSYNVGEIAGNSWAAHTVSAEVTFDGVTKSPAAAKTHHITGLPYPSATPKNTGNHPWTSNYQLGLNYVNWNADNVNISAISRSPIIISPQFHIPGDINVAVSSSFMVKGSPKTTYKVKLGSSELISKKDNSSTTHNLSGDGTFTTSNTTIQCQSTYGMAGGGVTIYSVGILYR